MNDTEQKDNKRAGASVQRESRRPANFVRIAAGLLTSFVLGSLAWMYVAAQPVRDRMLEDVRILLVEHGTYVEIRFPFRLQYLSHFPAAKGDELRIQFRPIQIPESDSDAVYKREALVPRYGEVVDLDEVVYEGDIDQGAHRNVYVTLRFRNKVAYDVTPSPDHMGVMVQVVPLESSESAH